MAAPGLAVGERTFRQSYAIRLVLAIFLILPAALFAWVGSDSTGQDRAMAWGIAAALFVVYAVLWVLIGRSSITINDMGIKSESVFGAKELLWAQVGETRYKVNPINWGAHFGLIGALIAMRSKNKSANLTFRVVGLDGKSVKITSNYQDAKEAIALVLQRVLPKQVADLRSRIARGETVALGPLSLSKTTIAYKSKDPIPLAELKSAELAGPALTIKRNGKWLSAISVASDKVPNVLALLEVLDGLAPQLKSTAVDPLARVRM